MTRNTFTAVSLTIDEMHPMMAFRSNFEGTISSNHSDEERALYVVNLSNQRKKLCKKMVRGDFRVCKDVSWVTDAPLNSIFLPGVVSERT